jgi:TonB-dependent starch-binding outer membrane protein SusC
MPFKTSGLTRTYLVLSFLLLSSSLFAQTTVTGKVIGSTDKQPVPFATVQVKGERGATQTAADGTFSIHVSKSTGTLVISAVGFETQQVPVNGSTAALGILTLNASTSTLNDIVVTGYTAQRKKDITGAVAVVNVADMKGVPGTSTEALLQGQAPGVTVINSGSPGGGSQILVRGITSIGNVSPLVIVDGVQSNMHDLNVNDIESVQILKDAGAVAIYGIQGSNGVVIITTKHGKSAKATIAYDGFVGVQEPLKNGFNLGGSQNYADVLWLADYNNGQVPGNIWFGQGGAGYAPPPLPAYLQPAPFSNATGTANPLYAANQNPSTYNIVSNQITKTNLTGTDWFHEIFKPAAWTQHTISASAGGEKSSYFVSLSYLDQQGTLINTYNKRYSARVNTTFAVKDHVRVGENLWVFWKQNPILGAGNQNEGNSISLSYRIPPIIPVYDIMGNYAGTHSFTINNAGNPVAAQARTANNLTNDVQINGNAFAEVDFMKHFTIRTSIGGMFDNNYYYNFSATPYENAEGSTAPNSFTEGSAFNSFWVWTNTLNYNQTFGKLAVKALAGTEAKAYYGRGLSGTEGSYFSTNPLFWTLSTGTPSTVFTTSAADDVTGLPYQSTLYSQFGRVDLAYQDKYLLSGTIRRDESSVFAPGHQVGIFPSVSAAWRLSQEDFLSSATWLKDLKIRGSWGKSGNLENVPGTNPYNLSNSSAFQSYYDIGGTSTSSQLGFYSSALGNTGTTWENDILSDVGVDASIQHFDLTADWFQKKISGLLFQPSLPNTIGGASSPYVNFGDIQNTGFDFSVGYHDQVNRDFRFGIGVTGTHYVSKVISLPAGLAYYSIASSGSSRLPNFSRMQPGTAIGEFFGYKVIGYFQNAADVAKSPIQAGAAPGAFKYADLDGQSTIDPNDETYIGNPNPKLTYGLNLNANYKNFDFFASFYGSYGNDIFNYIKYWTVFPQVFEGNVVKDLIANSWSPTNLNPKYPQITSAGSFSNANVINSWYVEKGSYFRLKSLNFGYTVDPVALHRVGIDKVRIYIQGANLFTITKYTGMDPELQGSNLNDQTNFGIDEGNYPANQKTYMVGLNVTF